MKTLLLIRHAKSSWKKPDLADVDRPLNRRGKRDARFMASVLGKVGIQPDRILTSPARRALKTARAIADILGCDRDRIVVDEAIYDTGYRALLGSIQAVEEGCDVLFVVGHNPEITELAEDFTSTEIRSVPTCGIFCCAFNIDSWSDICDGGGRLVFYDFPKNHPERKST